MKVMIGLPTLATMPIETVKSLFSVKIKDEHFAYFVSNSLIANARNDIASAAITNADYLLFVDSDMTFMPDIYEKLKLHDKDIVSGLAFKRKPPFDPTVFKNIKPRDETDPTADVIHDYPETLFEVDACGMAMCLIKTSVLKDIYDRMGNLFEPLPGLGEDLSFCYRAKKCGYKIFCDPTAQTGHVGTQIITELTYQSYKEMRDGRNNIENEKPIKDSKHSR